MKTQYETIMVKHVAAKLAKAKELGISASWSTANHLDALTEVINSVPAEQVRDALGECYNVSAFQQALAKKFEGKGHFQREATKSAKEKVDSLLDELAKQG